MSSNPTFVKSMNLFGKHVKQIPCIVGEGSPTESTAGAVGMLYMDTSSGNGEMYKCVKVEDDKYTWVKLVSEEIITIDSSLTQSGKAADAKTTGDEIKRVEDKIPNLDDYAKSEDIPTKPEDIGARPSTWVPTAQEVGADSKGTAASVVSVHNASGDAHNDIRLMVEAIGKQLAAFLDVDEETLNELSELIAAIVANQTSISQLTSGKVNISDIINNLSTNVTNKPLSAAQGVELKALIDGLSSGKLDASKLQEAINTALAQAKANGEFDGEDGPIPYIGDDGMWYVGDKCLGHNALGGYYTISIFNEPDPDTSNNKLIKLIVHYGASNDSLPEIPDSEIYIELNTNESNKTILTEALFLNKDPDMTTYHNSIDMNEQLQDGCLLEFELFIDTLEGKGFSFISYARYCMENPRDNLIFNGKIASSCDIWIYVHISESTINIYAECSSDIDMVLGVTRIEVIN